MKHTSFGETVALGSLQPISRRLIQFRCMYLSSFPNGTAMSSMSQQRTGDHRLLSGIFTIGKCYSCKSMPFKIHSLPSYRPNQVHRSTPPPSFKTTGLDVLSISRNRRRSSLIGRCRRAYRVY